MSRKELVTVYHISRITVGEIVPLRGRWMGSSRKRFLTVEGRIYSCHIYSNERAAIAAAIELGNGLVEARKFALEQIQREGEEWRKAEQNLKESLKAIDAKRADARKEFERLMERVGPLETAALAVGSCPQRKKEQ